MMRTLLASIAAAAGDFPAPRHGHRHAYLPWMPVGAPSPFGCSRHPDKNRQDKANLNLRRARKAKRKAAAQSRRRNWSKR